MDAWTMRFESFVRQLKLTEGGSVFATSAPSTDASTVPASVIRSRSRCRASLAAGR